MMHLALIPDGNRRFAESAGEEKFWGHLMGIRKMHEFIDWVLEHDEIDVVSAYALSPENLSRPRGELEKLWEFYREEFVKLKTDPRIVNNRIKVRIVGDPELWREDVRRAAGELMDATSSFDGKTFNILMAYSGEKEAEQAAKSGGSLMITRPVDLLIRTGGERRLSGMLPLQTAYAELYFSDTLFPAFTKGEFESVLKWFSNRDRRFGR